jgi:hypothetical protein
MMIGDSLPNNQSDNASPSNASPRKTVSRLDRSQRNIPRAQQAIYDHLLSAVQTCPPEDVLSEFKHLFIHHVNTASSELLPALYEIVFANNEQEFRHTLKRSCYILINNWDLNRNHQSIQDLVRLFSDGIIYRHTEAPILKRLRGWLKNFVNSKDFEELRLFASRYDQEDILHWSDRYTSYLLVPQYINLNNSPEQRESARALSQKLKEKFKFELAFYTVLSESLHRAGKDIKNPTYLGDDSLRLIKTVIAKQGVFSYANLANIFRQQTQNLTYQLYKKSLKNYLVYSLKDDEFIKAFDKQITEKLDQIYPMHEDKVVNDALILRTSNRLVDCLTTEDHESPSSLFLMLMSQGSPLTLVVVLLKIALMCPYVRTHLEARIADLIRYYEAYAEEDCQWVVNFFEIFNVVMTIHAESTEYTLVGMDEQIEFSDQARQRSLQHYRIFSQRRLLGEFVNLNPELDEVMLAALEKDLELDHPDGDSQGPVE